MSSLGKHPRNETPITGPSQCPQEEPEQRDDLYLFFNDGEDDDFFSDPDQPKNMAPVIEGQTPTQPPVALVEPIPLAPITWLVWPVDKDPTIQAYYDSCAQQGWPIDKSKWWMTCPLDDFCLRCTLAAMLADVEARTREQHGTNHHVE
jgi:hypothetical protein